MKTRVSIERCWLVSFVVLQLVGLWQGFGAWCIERWSHG
jgi:hypothetical protein